MYSTVNKIKGVFAKKPGYSYIIVDEVPLTSTIAAVHNYVYLAIIEKDFQAIMKSYFGGGERQMIVTNGMYRNMKLIFQENRNVALPLSILLQIYPKNLIRIFEIVLILPFIY